jgi:mono/diheme cytochrome c family protein
MKLILRLTFLLIPMSLFSTEILAEANGEMLYKEKCAMCHQSLGMGTRKIAENMNIPPDQAWLEKRENLPVEYVKYVVRNGKGIMFSLSRAEVSESQLEQIASYIAKDKKE